MVDIGIEKYSELFDGKGLVLTSKGAKILLKSFQTTGNRHVYFTCNGKLLYLDQLKHNDEVNELVVRGHICVLGGKGGFGSMLRAIGAQIEKTTNREACRDLSGRRMRDVNNEKSISEWLEKQKTEEEDKARRKKEKLERILNPPRHIVNDSTYVSKIKENAEKVDVALKQGLQKISSSDEISPSTSGIKRHLAEDPKQTSKKHKMWLGFDSDDSLDEVDDNENDSISNVASPVDQTATKAVSQLNSSSNFTREECQTTPDHKAKECEHQTDVKKVNDDTEKDTLPDRQQLPVQIEEIAKKTTSLQSFVSMDKIDLQSVSKAEDLEAYGLERLKSELMRHGLKCGGTLKQRAERLFLLKDTPVENLEKSLFAKGKKPPKL